MQKVSGMESIGNPEVAEVFSRCPKNLQEKLMFLRGLIFDTASETEGVGKLEETLKWGVTNRLTTSLK